MFILLINVIWAALKDGLSLNMIMISAVLMALYLLGWFRGTKVNLFIGLFIVEVMLFGFAAHLDIVTFNNPLRLFSLYYDLTAGILLIAGIALLAGWAKTISAGGGKESLYSGLFTEKSGVKFGFWQSQLISVLIIVAASALTIKDMGWAMDPYMTALSNNIFARVEGSISILSLCLYTLVKFWLIWAVIFIFSGSVLTRRLKIMIAAAFFLAAGSTLFYVK